QGPGADRRRRRRTGVRHRRKRRQASASRHLRRHELSYEPVPAPALQRRARAERDRLARGRRRAHLDRTARRARFACNARRKPDAHHLLPLGPRAARADPALRHRGLVEALLAVSFVRTLVLVAIALGLGAWLWFVEAPKAIQEAKKDFLADFDPAAVEKIQLSYTDQPQIEIVK